MSMELVEGGNSAILRMLPGISGGRSLPAWPGNTVQLPYWDGEQYCLASQLAKFWNWRSHYNGLHSVLSDDINQFVLKANILPKP